MVAVPENIQKLDKYQSWLNETLSGYRSYASQWKGFDIRGTGWDERHAYDFCNRIRDDIIRQMHKPREQKEQNPLNKHLHLKLCTEGNSSILYNLADGSVYAIMSREPRTGSVSYYGPERGLTMLGGRGELQGIVQDLRDGSYDGGYYQKNGSLAR